MGIRFFKYASIHLSISVILISLVLGKFYVFVAPLYVFGLIPLLELFWKGDTENMSKAEEEIAKNSKAYDIILWSVVPLQYAIIFFFLNRISDSSLAWWETLGMILSVGVSCGVLGINAAHELGHRNTWYEQLLSKMLLATSLYLHFFIEHNRGHHKNVSTEEDPASSRYGEWIYAFYIRSVRDSWLSAWHLQNDELRKKNTPFWSFKNEMLMYQFIQIGLLATIGFIWGWVVMLYFVAAATGGFLLLETVNYIEHYGLSRKKIDGEYYEKVMPIHSWNSNHPIGRIMLFELSRHSDHHYMASRKYQILRHFDHSPQMPTGYPGMMVLALFPPLWFKVMHKHIEKYTLTTDTRTLA